MSSLKCGDFGTKTIAMKVGASEVFKGKSGRFCQADGAGYIDAASATSVDILGWVEGHDDFTAAAADGGTIRTVDTDLGKLFVMPCCDDTAGAVTAAELQGAVGTTVDIQMVSTNYQYADLGASAVDILLVYGFIYEGSAAGQQYAIVKVNPNKLVYGTHTDV